MPQVIADSSVVGSPAIVATSIVARAVEGHSTNDHGIVGKSIQGAGIFGRSENQRGVEGHSTNDHGVIGESAKGAGVFGISDTSSGVEGHSKGPSTEAHGVVGHSTNGTGVFGFSDNQRGVEGRSTKDHGVVGKSTEGAGVFGRSENQRGVEGHSNKDHGVFGESIQGSGVLGVSENSNGLEGRSVRHIGIVAKGGRLAALFDGDVEVTGDIRLSNADCAEDFDMDVDAITEPGTVMVIRDEGVLRHSERAFDKKVAGVISGAGGYKPGMILDTHRPRNGRQPIALLGKVFCKVDAQFGAIEVGDLLTTSPTPGHAMKTTNPAEAFGAVLGKALRPFRDGTGLIPILIALQ